MCACRKLCQKDNGATTGTCTNKWCPLTSDPCDQGRECSSPRGSNPSACLLKNTPGAGPNDCPAGSIVSRNNDCASGRGCNGTANAARCLPCDSTGPKTCTGNLVCDASSKVCKCRAGSDCCSRDDHCTGPAKCVLPGASCGSRGRCLLDVKGECINNGQCGYGRCAGGKCDCVYDPTAKKKLCRTRAGRKCTLGSDECVPGLSCGIRAGDTASRCLLALGGQRCDWRQQCAETTLGLLDTFCDTTPKDKDGGNTCLLKVGSKCSALDDSGKSYCGDGTQCYKWDVATQSDVLCKPSDGGSTCTCKCPQEQSCCNVVSHCAVPGAAVLGTVVCISGRCDNKK